ncbi:cyclic nucleotide-binding/CBS domain-containing protein [Candidatus Manganitrophus noduliformans]|uniref:CBS domain-containing protein n=1 Tax=Candidatus Manganitrophus noduliformans TaxID=2606439 RepID=A0A7X6DPC5_9BACT|nr:CBS domain-containing protein [Candidatus Manganitrophus noduliformans]NKE70832.1 CBS domain-containing protein [Candidatus Manganitrophus noduliformans]
MIPLVERFMTTKINAIDAEKNIAEVAKEMANHRIGSLLVTRKGTYVGIITETDIVRKVIAKQLDPSGIPARQVMQSPLITIEADRTVMEANDLMEGKGIRHLAVTRGGEVVGVFSVRDLLRPLYMEEMAGFFLGPPE